MSEKRCCVPGCKYSEGMHHVLHGFPNPEKESEQFRVWLYAVGGDLLGLENRHIFKNRRVCHSHFEEKFQCRNNKISNIAVPTLHMPATSSNKSAVIKRKPMKEILNQANGQHHEILMFFNNINSLLNVAFHFVYLGLRSSWRFINFYI